MMIDKIIMRRKRHLNLAHDYIEKGDWILANVEVLKAIQDANGRSGRLTETERWELDNAIENKGKLR